MVFLLLMVQSSLITLNIRRQPLERFTAGRPVIPVLDMGMEDHATRGARI